MAGKSYPRTQKVAVSRTVDAVGHSLWRRTMNAKRVPFEASKKLSGVCFGGFRPLKHVKERRALARRAPLPMLFSEHPVNDPGENETG